jgi:hypothetical protein
VGRRLPDILADVISAAPVLAPASLRPDLPIPLSELCRRCLSKSPEDRYRTVREVRSALVELISQSRQAVRRVGSPTTSESESLDAGS